MQMKTKIITLEAAKLWQMRNTHAHTYPPTKESTVTLPFGLFHLILSPSLSIKNIYLHTNISIKRDDGSTTSLYLYTKKDEKNF